jgi:hypothetical protein
MCRKRNTLRSHRFGTTTVDATVTVEASTTTTPADAAGSTN